MLAAVAGPRPRLQPRASVFRRISGPLALARAPGHRAVALGLVGDRGGRAPEVARDVAGRGPPLPELSFDGGPLRPREPEVALLLPLCHDPCPYAAAPFGPALGQGFSDSTVRVRLTSRGKAKCSDQVANQLDCGFDAYWLIEKLGTSRTIELELT